MHRTDKTKDNDTKAEQDTTTKELQVNVTETSSTSKVDQAVKEAHPADVRRMMSQPDSSPKDGRASGGSNKQLSVKYTDLYNINDQGSVCDEVFDEYWDEQDFHQGDW